MKIQIICGGLCIAGCAASVVLAQSFSKHTITEYSGPIPASAAPKMRANFLQRASLDSAADAAQKVGDYAEAEMDARQALSLMKGDSQAQEILPAALDAQGKMNEALQAYKVLYDEGDVTPYNELPYARLLLTTGNWAQAVQVYNKQLPYLSNGDLMQAHSAFLPDVPRQSDLATAIHIGMGLELGWRGYHGTYQERIKQAQGQFQQAAVLEPNSSIAHYYVGYGLNRMGRRTEAQAAFKKAVALDDGDIKKAALKELPGGMQPR